MGNQVPKPPGFAEALLKLFCSDEVLETLLGDLYELHEKRTLEQGKTKADLYFFLEVMDSCRPFAWKKKRNWLTNFQIMFQYNFKIACRQFLRQKVFTLINIFGLTLGFSSFLLILFFVNHERSFDQFHTNHEHIFRVNFSFQDIACLGLYGIITFMVNNRIKEIGIRKTLGASVSSLYSLFVKTYMYQTIIAMIIMLPCIHYLLSRWLENFAYHIQIQWWIYPMVTLLLGMIILITITFQILKAVNANPSRLIGQE